MLEIKSWHEKNIKSFIFRQDEEQTHTENNFVQLSKVCLSSFLFRQSHMEKENRLNGDNKEKFRTFFPTA